MRNTCSASWRMHASAQRALTRCAAAGGCGSMPSARAAAGRCSGRRPTANEEARAHAWRGERGGAHLRGVLRWAKQLRGRRLAAMGVQPEGLRLVWLLRRSLPSRCEDWLLESAGCAAPGHACACGACMRCAAGWPMCGADMPGACMCCAGTGAAIMGGGMAPPGMPPPGCPAIMWPFGIVCTMPARHACVGVGGSAAPAAAPLESPGGSHCACGGAGPLGASGELTSRCGRAAPERGSRGPAQVCWLWRV